jgi:hypothetical protein
MNKVVHFEIPADDLERAKKFYSIFDWQLADWPMPDGSVYVGARTVDVDEKTHLPKEPGAINGGITKRTSYAATPQFTILVPSIDDYAVKIKAAGGKLVQDKMNMADAGYYAYFKDSEGNLFSLWEDIKK